MIVLRNAKGLGNDEVIDILRSKHKNTLVAAHSYLERIALVKVISEVTDRRRAIPIANQNQGELFELACPPFISLTILEDGKPKRIRKDFLDATLEEAEKALEPIQPRVPNVDKDARARAFIEKLRPVMSSTMTFREAVALLKKG